MTDIINPTGDNTQAVNSTVDNLDSQIAAKMAAMVAQRNAALPNRNQPTEVKEPTMGDEKPQVPQVDTFEDTEVTDTEDTPAELTESPVAPDEVSEVDAVDDTESTTQDELIDFVEFANTNPNAKFKFKRNGEDIVIDAKKAAAILGQGSAISEDARQLKIQRSEFDEYLKEKTAYQEGLTLAMEFTVQPQLQQAYDEIIKVNKYQQTFQQQLANTYDEAERARIMANLQQNEQYIRQQSDIIAKLKPNVDEFKKIRQEQVKTILETNRKSFQDKELKNEYLYNELKTRLGKVWQGANGELIPGIKNIDMIMSDEALLGIINDGLKYRNKPSIKSTASINSLSKTGRSLSSNANPNDDLSNLRKQAYAGDKKAGDNLLEARLKQIQAARKK